MTPDEVAAFLDTERVLNVATIGPTGHPHVVPMWFVVIDGRPSFWTFAKSQKVVNLRRDPRITALVEAGDSYPELRGAEVTGTAGVVDDHDAVMAIGRGVAEKYSGGLPLRDDAIAALEAQAAKRVGITIDVDRTVSWDHRKLTPNTY